MMSGSFTLTDPVKSVWAKTQDKDYLTQMKSGVRFLISEAEQVLII